MVCLAGLTRNARDYDPVARRLAPRRRVICMDYRGRGQSARDPDSGNYHPTVYLRDLNHLLAAANLGHVVICGTSLGGLLAMGFALFAPASMAGVILNDASPQLDETRIKEVKQYVGKPVNPADWSEALAYVKSVYANMGLDSDEDWLEITKGTFREDADGRLSLDYDMALADQLGGPVPDLWPIYRALRPIATLAIRGETSTVVTAEAFERMLEEKPDLQQVTVPGVGHTPRLIEPHSIRAIDDFLEQIDKRGH